MAVVIGGAHATALPDEAVRHADAVVVSEAEDTWPRVLDDARRGEKWLVDVGPVADAKVLRSIPLLDKAALAAVRQWHYQPVLLKGTAVPVIMTEAVPVGP